MDETLGSSEPLADYQRWLQPGNDGGVALVDPESGRPLTECPHMISRDLGDGFDFLQANAHSLQITIAYGAHDHGSDLSSPDDPLWLEHQVADTDLLIHESDAPLAREWAGMVRDKYGADIPAEVLAGMPFDVRLACAATEADVPDAPCEPEEDDGSRTARTIDGMADRMIDLYRQEGSVPAEFELVHGILRNYSMVGYAGRKIMEAVGADVRLMAQLQHGALRILIPVGLAHQDMTRIFGGNGVVVSEVQLAPQLHDPMIDIARTGVIPASEASQ